MAQHLPSRTQSEFLGVRVNAPPLPGPDRPPTSASYMHNFRLLKGLWLRLWGGRKARYYNSGGGEYRQLLEFKDLTYSGFNSHALQYNNGTTVKWQWLALIGWTIADIITISQTYDGGYTQSNPAANTLVRDRVVLYNGYGVRDGTDSRPALTNWTPSVGFPHYFGLDAYCPGGSRPTITNGSGSITILTHYKGWVGLYNSTTGHFSNAVYCGQVGSGASRSLDFANLTRLVHHTHNASESSALKLVFYLSIDGGDVGYLVMDATNPYIPHTESYGTASKSFTAAPTVDLTKSAPTRNHPPRPMRWIAYVGGRMYGALMSGGAHSAVFNDGFSYVPSPRFYPGIVYSEVQGRATELIGNPEECWPPDNFSAVPNSEIPLAGLPIQEDHRLFIICPTSCFIVEEAADGLHEWTRVSTQHGITVPKAAVETDRGIVWMDQNNQILALDNTRNRAVVLSGNYDPILRGKTVRFGTYTLDPMNGIDRVEFYFTDGTGVCHDFNNGEGYTFSGDFVMGRSVKSATNVPYHILAKTHLFSQAGQHDYSGKEYAADETFDGGGNVVRTAITGEWRTQWLDFGDEERRKEIARVRCLGDAGNTVVEFYQDYKQITAGNKGTSAAHDTPQAGSVYSRVFRLAHSAAASLNAFVWKFVFKLTGPSTDTAHNAIEEYGDLAESGNFRGVIFRILYGGDQGQNRPL